MSKQNVISESSIQIVKKLTLQITEIRMLEKAHQRYLFYIINIYMNNQSSFQNPLIPDLGDTEDPHVFPATPEKMLDCGYQAFFGQIDVAGISIMVRK